MKKSYVLDTSVLIHDPSAILHFGDNNVIIPIDVLQELDRIKTEGSDRGRAARGVQRKLLEFLPAENLGENAPLPNGGTIRLLLPPHHILSNGNGGLKKVVGDMHVPDHRIIACAEWLAKESPNERVILVTKDMGMMLKGRALGLNTEDYEFDKVSDSPIRETTKIQVSDHELQHFLSEGWIELPLARTQQPDINQYGLFIANKRAPWRHIGEGRFVTLKAGQGVQIPRGTHIQAKNLEQLFLLDALLNPDIHLITAAGPAGTGKTLLTMAAGLHLIGKKIYTGMCISKPNESIGKENGFLPGTLEEKLRPWLQPYADALNFLHQTQNPQNKRQSQRKQGGNNKGGQHEGGPPKRPYDHLTEAGIVEITALEYIRGRSIPTRIFIADECQNVRAGVVKTIASRMAEGSKLILLGDPEQIDNPYLDAFSNGLTHVRANMANLSNAAHITLLKGERSLLAEQAAKLL
jgi:PhoH-like ATPase